MTYRAKWGFSFIEVMVALVILTTSLIVLLDNQGRSMDLVRKARSADVAVELASEKMNELVAVSNEKGPTALKQEEGGEFDQEKFPGFKWRYRTLKVPTPNFAGLLGLAVGGDKENKDTSASNAALFEGPLQQIGKIWGEALRELHVEVTWPDGHGEKNYELVTHLISPDALGQVQGMVGGLGGQQGGTKQ